MKPVKAWAVLEKNNKKILGSFAYILVIYNRKGDAEKFHVDHKTIPVLITPLKKGKKK